MTKEQSLRIALALQGIAMLVDDESLEKIKPYLIQVEKIVEEILDEEKVAEVEQKGE